MLLVGLSSIAVSCATPPDVPMCTELIKDTKGWCAYTLSDKEFFVDNDKNLYPIKDESGKNPTWLEVKATSLIVPAQSAARTKNFILKACKKMKTCNQDIAKWQRKADSIVKEVKK